MLSLFVDGNPVGVKCAMAHLGLLGEYLRLPLVGMQSPNREKMLMEMQEICKHPVIKKHFENDPYKQITNTVCQKQPHSRPASSL